MHRLGYERYGAAGNDVGSEISPEVGRCDPEHVIGVHVTQVFSQPSGDLVELARLSEEDLKKVQFLQWFWDSLAGYHKFQSTAPQTLAHALADSLVGQLAWSYQLFGDSVSDDYILTNATIYWLTNTAASSARLYYENAHATDVPTGPTTVPLSLANFASDFQSIRPFAERDHKNIVS
jgi:epoxide hydrolase